MRKILMMTGLILFMTGCTFTSSQHEEVYDTHNLTAIEILAEDHEADIFQYNNVIYENASNVDWVQEETYEKGAKVGEITNQSNDGESFIDYTANKLSEGTKVFQTKGKGLLLLIVEHEGEEVMYLGLVEG